MNLILLEPRDLDDTSTTAVLQDLRRLTHLKKVLRVAIGDTLRTGVIDQDWIGVGHVVAISEESITLRCEFRVEPALARPEDTLLLAMPRPKILGRILEDATALGFGHIVLFRSWHVDKSHLRSQQLEAHEVRRRCVLGLEQSARTRLPAVHVFDLFKPFLEDHLERVLPQSVPRERRYVAHLGSPDAALPEAARSPQSERAAREDHATPSPGPFALAVGPERGFTPYEVKRLMEHHFTPLALNPGILRVETAVATAHGQLATSPASLGP